MPAGAQAGSAWIAVRPDLTGFHTTVRRSLQQLTPQMSRIGREWGRALADGIGRELRTVEVRVDTGRAMAEVTRLGEELDRLDRRRVDVEVNVDADRGAAALQRVTDSAGRASRGLNLLGKATAVAKLPALGVSALGAAAGVAQLAAQLAPVAGLAAGLPAAFGAMAVASNTLRLAVSGVGEAFGAAFEDDAAKFEESLKNLAPAAQATARELRSLRGDLLGIRAAAQQALFAPLVGQLRATVQVLGGPLRAGVREVAGEFGLAGRSVLQFAQSGQAVGALRALFGGVAAALRGIQPAIQPVLAGLAAMAQQGTGWVVQLGDAIGRAGARFGQWLQAFAASGGVDRAIGGAVTLLQQLGTLLTNIGGILQSVMQAAQSAGGGLFGVLGQLTGQLNMFLKTAAGQQALRAFFQIMSELGRAIAPIVPIVGQLVGQLVSALLPVVQALSPLLNVLIRAFGQILGSLTPILAPLGQLIASLITGLMPILQPIIQLIAQTAAQIGSALVQALVQCMPALQQIVLAVASLLPALMPLIPTIGQLVIAILPLVPAVVQLAAMLVGLLAPVLRVVLTVVVQVVNTILGWLIPVVRQLVSIIVWAAGQIGPLFTWLWERAIGPALRGIGAVVTWVWQTVMLPAWRGIQAAVQRAWSVVRPIWQTIANVLRAVLGVAFRVLGNVVKIVWIGIQLQIKAAWAVIKVIFNAIRAVINGVLAPVFRWLWNNVIKPVWNSIKNHISTVYNNGIKPAFEKLRSGVNRVRDAFRTAVDGIRKIWDGLREATRKPVNFVIGVYNNGIVRLVNKIAEVAGLKTRLSTIPKFARGGVLPGYKPGVDELIAAVSPGEAIMRPEFTRAVGEGFIHRANDVARRSGVEGVRRWLTGRDAMGGEGMAFANGGVVPRFAGHYAFGGIIGRFVDGVKNFTIGNVGKAARGLLDKILGGAVPGAGIIRDVVAQIPSWIKDTVLKWVTSKVDSGVGGPAVQRALRFAKAQAGKPYIWGGVGPGGYDCSGFMSAITNVIQGRSPYSRRFTTFSFTGARQGPAGFVRNLRSGFVVGVTNAGVGHMAGTLGGVNVESRGSAGVVVGPRARGAGDGLFSMRYGLRFNKGGVVPTLYDDGGWLPPGLHLVANRTRRPEPILPPGVLDALVDGRSGGSVEYHAHFDGLTRGAIERQVRAGIQAEAILAAQRDRTGRRR